MDLNITATQLTETFMTFTNYVNHVSGGNEMLSAFIFLSLTSVVTFILYKVPPVLWNLFKNRFLVTLTVTSSGHAEEVYYHKINDLLMESFTLEKCKTLYMQSKWDVKEQRYAASIRVGYGRHFVMHGGIPMLITKGKEEKAGLNEIIQTMDISTLKIFASKFSSMTKEMNHVEKDDKLTIHQINKDGEWEFLAKEPKRDISSIALDADTKKVLSDRIEFFLEKKDEYRRLNLNHKETIILHGEPGSGKTSLIKALASEYDFSILTVNVNVMTDGVLQSALAKAPKRSIVLIEDFDSAASLAKRKKAPKRVTNIGDAIEAENDPNESYGEFTFLTLTGVLNALDGVCSLDETLIFMTTNHLDQIDEAIFRPGRVDLVMELPNVNSETAKAYFETIYPSFKEKDIIYPDFRGCDINRIVSEAKLDAEKAANLINGIGELEVTKIGTTDVEFVV